MNNLIGDLGQAGHGKLEGSPSRWINDSPGRLWAFLGAAGLLLFLCGLGNHGLWGAEEPYVAGIIREMADSHNWVIPTLNGHPYLEKPPLYYVTGVLATRLFSSFAPWVLRLPSALFALATMAWIAWLAARRGAPAAGWWAALCLGTSDLFFRIGHKALVDMSLVFAVSVGLGVAWLLFEEPEHRDRWIPWLWLSLGLAFMAKGPVGPLLVLLPLGLHLALFRDRPLLDRLLKPQWGMAAGLVMVGSWVVLVYHQGGWPSVEEALVRNSVGRFFQLPGLVPATGAFREHRQNILYYVTHSPFNLMPWLLLAGAALLPPREDPGSNARNPAYQFMLLVLLVDLVFLSVSGIRRAAYFLPLVPFIFLRMGLWLEQRIRRAEAGKRDRAFANLAGITGTLICMAVAIAPWFLARRYGLSWKLPVVCTVVAAGVAAMARRRILKRDYRGFMDHVLGIWMAGMVLAILVVPPLKDPDTHMVDQAFWAARERVRTVGAEVWEAGLPESDLGLASLIIRKLMQSVKTLGQIEALMAQDRPVVVLAAPGALLGTAALENALIVRPEMPVRGVQGTGLCLVLNRKAALGLPGEVSNCKAAP
jgi:4-amino-4-deoxy-L-arabinose transferase-like glycosyltransferase